MKCVRCNSEKDASAFYKGDSSCKDCRKALVLAYRANNIEKCRQYDRDRSALQHRKEQNKRVTKAWQDNNPRERAAQNALNNAVRDGRVFKWPACAMPDCTSTKPVAHHADYDRPLDVVWLCQAHHKQAHALIE